MWDRVFSLQTVLVYGTAGLLVFVFFRLVQRRPPSVVERCVALLMAMTVDHWLSNGSAARALPSGYVGEMVQICLQEESRETCLCAVDRLQEQLGEGGVVRLGVRAAAGNELPGKFVTALNQCRE